MKKCAWFMEYFLSAVKKTSCGFTCFFLLFLSCEPPQPVPAADPDNGGLFLPDGFEAFGNDAPSISAIEVGSVRKLMENQNDNGQ